MSDRESGGVHASADSVDWRADVRLEVYLKVGALESARTLEVALSAEGVGFAMPPATGDSFLPGALGKGLLVSGLWPEVARVEHSPSLPFHDDAERAGYACVIIVCSTTSPLSDELVATWETEGWHVHDFRQQNQVRRSSHQ